MEPYSSYAPPLFVLNPETLKWQRHVRLDLYIFSHKLLTENIDRPDVLCSLSFYARTTQSENVFRLNLQVTNYVSNNLPVVNRSNLWISLKSISSTRLKHIEISFFVIVSVKYFLIIFFFF